MGHLAQSNPIVKNHLGIKQKWVFKLNVHQPHAFHLLGLLFLLLGPRGLPRSPPAGPERNRAAPGPRVSGRGEESSSSDPGISPGPERAGCFLKLNALIFAFQPEGRLQTSFPPLLLRELATIPDAASRVRKGIELFQAGW